MSQPSVHEQALDIAIRELEAIARRTALPEVVAGSALARIKALLNHPSAAPAAPQVVSGSGKRFVVYSDGGCRNNPGPAGWGVVIVDADSGAVLEECSGFIGTATNQVAELVAAIEGLSRIPIGAAVELVSDSQYTLRGLTEWRAGWIRRGWRNSNNEPVANQDHWKKLYAVADKLKITTRWVKGHNGDHYNERCDALAANVIASSVDI